MKARLEVFDRQDKRVANLNIEYLKNIVLGFLDAESDKSKLLPVIEQVLYLSTDESLRLRKSFEYSGIAGAVISGFGFF